MVHSVLYVEIDIFAALVILVIMNHNAFSALDTNEKAFKSVLIALIFVLLSDAATWGFDGSEEYFGMLVFSEYFYYIATVLVCYFMLLYCRVFCYGSLEFKWAAIFAIPVLLAFILLAVNPFTGLIFTFDASCLYCRSSYFFLIGSVNYIHLIAGVILAARRALSSTADQRKPYTRLITFLMVTLLGSLIQMLIYGAVTIWISAVLSMLMCYVYLQNNNLAMDALTHLNNRRRFDEFVKTESEHPNQLGEFFLLVLDIDHFKMINDTYGHAEGDQALVSAACVLKKAMEDEHGFLARIGGDEFAIILPAANEDIIENLIFKIRCLMDNTNKEAGKPYEINFSIGHASQYGNELNFEKLFSDADENMYESKKKNHDKSTCS